MKQLAVIVFVALLSLVIFWDNRDEGNDNDHLTGAGGNA